MKALKNDDCKLVEEQRHAAPGIHCSAACEQVEAKTCNVQEKAQHGPDVCADGLLGSKLANARTSAIKLRFDDLVLLFCRAVVALACSMVFRSQDLFVFRTSK